MSEFTGLRTKTEAVKAGAKLLQQGLDILRAGPLTYYLEDLCGSVEYLMERFSPIKVGDRVELLETPEISEKVSWGWLGAKHFLVAGAIGTARHVECSSRGIGVHVEWDDETWVDREGVKRQKDAPCLYMHRETTLRKIDAPAPESAPAPSVASTFRRNT